MIEKLIEVLTTWAEFFRLMVVVDEFEGGVILRWGQYHRDLHVGRNWMIPGYIEKYYHENVVFKTIDNMVCQSLTTRDGKGVIVSAIVSYKIRNTKRWLLEVEDGESVLSDLAYGTIGDFVRENDWEYIRDTNFKDDVYKELKSEASKKMGVDILGLKFTDLAVADTFRAIRD